MERLVLKGCRFIITQDRARRVLENKDILIENGLIKRIGRINAPYRKLDCSHKLVMPGLINLHTHTITNLLRGISDDLKLKEWLERKVWPAEAKIDDAYYGALLTCIESIKNGTTCFMDMSFQMERVLRAVKQTKLRAFLGYGMIDLWNKERAERELRYALEFINETHNESLITPTLAPHAPNTCSEFLLKEAARLSVKHGLINQCHILETEEELKTIRQKAGCGVLEYLERLGFLNNLTLGIHLCWLRPQEAEILAKHKCSVVHCPVSNMKLASGSRLPVEVLTKLGIKVGLGTDSTASNNNLDVFEELKQAGLLHKFSLNDATAVPVQKLLDMATRDAARILGIRAGQIKEGYLADVITLRLDNARMVPYSASNIVSHVVYSASGSDVDDTIVNGEILMSGRTLRVIDESSMLKKIQGYYTRILPG